MGNVRYVDFSVNNQEEIWKTDECAGCHKSVEEVGKHTTLKLPYEGKIEYIVLCKKCYKVAQEHGVL